MRAIRVVSLVPSATETLLAWGLVPVGVTRFCQHPELPQVGGTKDPDLAAVAALHPDLVVLCEEENRREDAEALSASGVATHVVRIDELGDVAPEMAALASAIGVEVPADWCVPELPAPAARRRAFVPIWRRPWMTLGGGCYGSSLLGAIGFDNVFADAPERYPSVTMEKVAARRPEVVLAPSEPYPFSARHRAELEALAPVHFVDGQDLFWWGVRTPRALERLAAELA